MSEPLPALPYADADLSSGPAAIRHINRILVLMILAVSLAHIGQSGGYLLSLFRNGTPNNPSDPTQKAMFAAVLIKFAGFGFALAAVVFSLRHLPVSVWACIASGCLMLAGLIGISTIATSFVSRQSPTFQYGYLYLIYTIYHHATVFPIPVASLVWFTRQTVREADRIVSTTPSR